MPVALARPRGRPAAPRRALPTVNGLRHQPAARGCAPSDASFTFSRRGRGRPRHRRRHRRARGRLPPHLFVDPRRRHRLRDKYYDTSTSRRLSCATAAGHSGSNPLARSFVGLCRDSVVSPPDGSPSRSPSTAPPWPCAGPWPVPLISTDLRRFIEQSARLSRGREAAADGKGGEPSRAPALGDYRVTMHTSLHPCSFQHVHRPPPTRGQA